MNLPGTEDGRSGIAEAIAEARRAIGFLTRLPVSHALELPGERLAAAVWAFPLAGLLVGGLAATLLLLLDAVGAPPLAAIVLALAFATWFTRALHEDGLADFADGIGGPDRARRLEIMRDSRIGAFGVLALLIVFALRLVTLAELPGAEARAVALVVAAVLARAAMVPLMHALPAARSDGLAHHAGRPTAGATGLSLAIAVALALLALSWEFVLAGVVAMAIAVGAVHRLARSRLGGRTGDVLGAAQQTSEAAFLLALAMVAT